MDNLFLSNILALNYKLEKGNYKDGRNNDNYKRVREITSSGKNKQSNTKSFYYGISDG